MNVDLFVRPMKDWTNREVLCILHLPERCFYSETMFLPHRYVPGTGEFKPILDGVMASRFYQVLGVNASSPELGVPAVFSDISEFEAICEIADSGAGYNPELSYGSHFFQDLVESGILYNAIFENEKTLVFNMELLKDCENCLCEFDERLQELKDIVKVYRVSDMDLRICNDMKKGRIICFR